MDNSKEELAEYIIKNLVFIVLFLCFTAYAISTVILPQVNEYKAQKSNLRYTQIVSQKAIEQNNSLNRQIENIQHENQKLLNFLKEPPTPIKIQALAQEFFEVNSLKQIDSKKNGIFLERIFRIQGRIENPQIFFSFSKSLETQYPNITLILPFEMKKNSLLDSMLELTFYFKITQIDKK